MEAEPPTYSVQIILGSGASEHVASREDFPGYGVGESPGSKAGKHYTGASGHRIRNEGEAKVQMIAPAGDGKHSELSTVFQVAKVTRPLMFVSKICKGSVSVMKTVKIAISECPWGSRGSKIFNFVFSKIDCLPEKIFDRGGGARYPLLCKFLAR